MRQTLFGLTVVTVAVFIASAVFAQQRDRGREDNRRCSCCAQMGNMANMNDMEQMRDTRAAPRDSVQIAFHAQPDPPKAGENQLEATVKTPGGTPITDADVSVTFLMPAMPSMNMPEMRQTARLAHAGGGVYRGKGEIPMAGRWEVTVSVGRGGQSLGSKTLTVTAR